MTSLSGAINTAFSNVALRLNAQIS
jgi:hypothetical protein